MLPFILHHPWMLLLLLLVPVFVVLFRMRLRHQKRDIWRFGQGAEGHRSEHVSMEPWRLLLLVLATITLIVALARPAVNPHPQMIQREGRDVVFLLDVSKSMLAEDRLPNRLESAKASIGECVSELDDHRVGLVVFAGSSSIVCPLTTDKDFFMNSLEKAGPHSVAHGGTRIGDALLKVCDKLFSDRDQGYKDIVLLSDGGDQSDGLDKAVEQMNQQQVRLIAIGMGDPQRGSRIPSPGDKSDFMLYENQEVWTRLDGAQLSALVKSLELGAYLPVGTRQMQLGTIYKRLSEQGGTQQLAEESVIVYDDVFQIFVGMSFLLLIMMAVIPHTLHRPLRSVQAGLTVLLMLILTDHADASGDAQRHYLEGNTHYRSERFSEAVNKYQSALQQKPDGRLIRDITYNLGNAYFRLSESSEDQYEALSLLNQSIVMYRRVLLQETGDQQAAVNNELARVKRAELKQNIAEEEERRRKMQAALEEIRKKLVSLVHQQRQNLPRKEEPQEVMPDQWELREQLIADETDNTTTLVNQMNEQFFKDIPRDLTPVAECKKHLSTAFLHQREAIMICKSEWPTALEKGQASLESLLAALNALPQESDDSGQGSEESDESEDGEESESSDQGDESEGDQESEESSGEEGEMSQSDTPEMDLNSIDLPPPSNSPEDVIRMSQEMQNARQAEGAKKKGKAVEKDW